MAAMRSSIEFAVKLYSFRSFVQSYFWPENICSVLHAGSQEMQVLKSKPRLLEGQIYTAELKVCSDAQPPNDICMQSMGSR